MAPTRILVAVDGTPSGWAALGWADTYARADDGEVVAVVPARPAILGLPPDPAFVPAWRAREAVRHEVLLDDARRRIGAAGRVLAVGRGLRSSLVRIARLHRADLLVIGRGAGVLAALDAALTSTYLRWAAHRPVQVVPSVSTPSHPRRSATAP